MAEVVDQPGKSSPQSSKGSPELTVIVPVFNEVDNVELLCEEVHAALDPLAIDFELIYVDDGSTDGTSEVLGRLAQRWPKVRCATLRRNFGQTAALSAGIDLARGDVLLPMDGDLQNDPADIPRLFQKIREGYDVVSGWRRRRRDSLWSRRLPSLVANRLVSLISGVRLHDFGCTLKAYRQKILEDVRLYGEMHRFVPIYAAWQGARVVELEVRHRPRSQGRSKYGVGRTFRVVLDLVLLRFLDRYSQRPMHLFGGFGLIALLLAFLTFALAAFFKIVKLAGEPSNDFVKAYGKDFVETPLPVLVVLFAVTGILSILMGLLAEMVMRTYFESQNKRPYAFKGSEGTYDQNRARERGPEA